MVINQAANVTISQKTNRTPEIRLEHIPSWSQRKKKKKGRKRNKEPTACLMSINKSNVVEKKLVSNFKVVEGPHFRGQTASHTCKLAT